MRRKLKQISVIGRSLILAGLTLALVNEPIILASETMSSSTNVQEEVAVSSHQSNEGQADKTVTSTSSSVQQKDSSDETESSSLKNYQMPIPQGVALETNFDYSLLDEPGDREGFISQSINTPVKVFDDEYRDYYGFFGGTKPTDSSANFLAKKSNDAASQVGKPLNSSIMSFLNPAIIAVPKNQTNKPITYSYAFGSAPTVPAGQTGFDFAELDQQNKLNYTASLYSETLINTRGFSESTVEELLVSEDKKTMYVYGKQKLFGSYGSIWNSPSRPTYYVRTKITLLKNGRARFTLRVYNPSEENKKLTASFGNHMDIEGQHTTSKMYTMGNNEGLYFNEAKLNDGYPYLLNFHLSGYIGDSNPPQNYKANNNAAFTLINGLGNHTMTYPVAGDVDKPAGTQIPSPSTHPGFTFQYQPVEISAKGYQDFDMDVSIRTEVVGVEKTPITVKYVDQKGKEIAPAKEYGLEVGQDYNEIAIDIEGYSLVGSAILTGTVASEEPILLTFTYEENNYQTVTVSYVDESGNPIDLAENKSYQLKAGARYEETALSFIGYKLKDQANIQSGEIVAGQDVNLTFNYQEHRFEIGQEVEMSDGGGNADEVNAGDKLLYTVKITSQLPASEGPELVNYQMFTIKELVDPSLEDVSKLTLKTAAGDEVGTLSYDEQTSEITAVIEAKDQVGRDQDLILSYQATVREDSEIGTVIKEQATAEGSYSDGMIATKKTSNEVTSIVKNGSLLFMSAPKSLNFGEKLAISAQDEVYLLQVKEKDLIVKDLRGAGNQWSMSAKMLQNMTNGTKKLSNSLYYRHNGVEQLISEESSANIFNQTTINSDPVVISEDWEHSENQPYMKVKAGEAVVGDYQGTIQWSIQDVPEP